MAKFETFNQYHNQVLKDFDAQTSVFQSYHHLDFLSNDWESIQFDHFLKKSLELTNIFLPIV